MKPDPLSIQDAYNADLGAALAGRNDPQPLSEAQRAVVAHLEALTVRAKAGEIDGLKTEVYSVAGPTKYESTGLVPETWDEAMRADLPPDEYADVVRRRAAQDGAHLDSKYSLPKVGTGAEVHEELRAISLAFDVRLPTADEMEASTRRHEFYQERAKAMASNMALHNENIQGFNKTSHGYECAPIPISGVNPGWQEMIDTGKRVIESNNALAAAMKRHEAQPPIEDIRGTTAADIIAHRKQQEQNSEK